ncbi:hypothetical protein ACOMHN_004006 [Nucella lapillus]
MTVIRKTLLLAAVVGAVLPACQGAVRREVSMTLDGRAVSLDDLPEHLNLDIPVKFYRSQQAKTAKGHDRLKIEETFGGLQVVGASADVEVTEDGSVTGSLSGTLAFHLEKDIPDPNACRRDVKDIKDRVKQYLKDEKNILIGPKTPMENFKHVYKVDFEGDNAPAKLICEVDCFLNLQTTVSRPFFQLDACDPDLAIVRFFDKIGNMTLAHGERRVKRQNRIPRSTGPCPSTARTPGVGGNAKIGKITYGNAQPACLPVHSSNGKCSLKSKHGAVYDAFGSSNYNGYNIISFDCAKGYNRIVNKGYGAANDAFYYAHTAGLMYEQWYGLYALGKVPQLIVHYRTCYDNAFYAGNAMIYLGDGCTYFYPMVSQDLVAHELAHALVDRFSKLYFQGQPGAIHEAFADMSGETAEFYERGANDWKMIAELTQKANMEALRYLDKPSRDGHSIDSAKDYVSSKDVHYTSGVFNRAFYQLVTVQRLPIMRAYEVFFQANRVIWKPTTNFQEGACGAMKAAYDLGYDINKIKNAFSVVDIDLSDCDYKAFKQTLNVGETRSGVLVSDLRNPIFAFNATDGINLSIEVSGTSSQVIVSLSSDAAGSNVIGSSPAPYTFQKTPQIEYFKLSTHLWDDIGVQVTMKTTS